MSMDNQDDNNNIEEEFSLSEVSMGIAGGDSFMATKAFLQEPSEEESTIFDDCGAIEYPYCPKKLFHVVECSGALRSNLDAMSTNIDGFGHLFRPTVDVDADGVDDLLSQAIMARQSSASPKDLLSSEEPEEVDQATLDLLKKKIKAFSTRERLRLTSFFENCVLGDSFQNLRYKTRYDLEACGNAFWAVTRDSQGVPYLFSRISPTTIRLRKVNPKAVEVTQDIRKDPITFSSRKVFQRFRTFVSDNGTGNLTYYKQFGDPSTYSALTGTRYKNYRELQLKESEFYTGEGPVPEATEVIHFKIDAPISCYGVPRWIGEASSVLGTSNADEVNLMYFDNKGIPPMVIKVLGGRLSQETRASLEDYISNEIRGKKNFHKIMILESEPSAKNGPPLTGMQTSALRIEMDPLTKFQQDDGQFLNYIERSTDRLGQAFRLPRLLRGDSRNANRATAQTSLRFAEGQVFRPGRNYFDFIMNSQILPALGVRYHTFESKGPDFMEPAELTMMLSKLSSAGVLTPHELRDLAEKAFGTRFTRIQEGWATRPTVLTQAAIISKLADVNGSDHYVDSFELQKSPPAEEAPEDKDSSLEDAYLEGSDEDLEKEIEKQIYDL